MEDTKEILEKWTLLCGGISDEHKISIITKIIENRDIDRKLLDINYKISNLLYELDLMKLSEKKEIKSQYNDKLNTIEGLIKEKGLLIQNKAEIL